MDPGNLPPLRTGLGNGDAPTAEIEQTKRRLLATVTVMTGKAGSMAYQYCIHDSREEVTHADMTMALKHQAMHFLKTVDDPEVVEEIIEMETLMFCSESDEEIGDTEDTASSLESEAIKTRELDPVSGKCTCRDCTEMRASTDTWDSWDPEDEAEKYLKERVDLAIQSTST